jgi:hypothetical protein
VLTSVRGNVYNQIITELKQAMPTVVAFNETLYNVEWEGDSE